MANEPTPNTLDRLKVVEALLQAFKLERYIYIGLTVVCFVVLITVSIWQFVCADSGSLSVRVATLFGLLTPTGIITATVGRLLYMWNQALKFINSETTTL
jgi:hypothetical protein